MRFLPLWAVLILALGCGHGGGSAPVSEPPRTLPVEITGTVEFSAPSNPDLVDKIAAGEALTLAEAQEVVPLVQAPPPSERQAGQFLRRVAQRAEVVKAINASPSNVDLSIDSQDVVVTVPPPTRSGLFTVIGWAIGILLILGAALILSHFGA
jgi:hypothetical protein